MTGSWALYALAAWVGPQRLHRFVARYGRWLRLGVHDLDRAETWFDRRAVLAVSDHPRQGRTSARERNRRGRASS